MLDVILIQRPAKNPISVPMRCGVRKRLQRRVHLPEKWPRSPEAPACAGEFRRELFLQKGEQPDERVEPSAATIEANCSPLAIRCDARHRHLRRA